jgi:hypothetical protein
MSISFDFQNYFLNMQFSMRYVGLHFFIFGYTNQKLWGNEKFKSNFGQGGQMLEPTTMS